jgi:hypothetical protein
MSAEPKRRRTRALLASVAFALFATLSIASTAFGYSFGSTVTGLGPEQTVFDWSTMACEPLDIPDTPARAFRDSSGRVQLIASHFVVRRMIGPSLLDLRHDCRVVMRSHFDANPAAFEDREWIRAPYTENGRKVYALLTNEFQGWRHTGTCPAPYIWKECWLNSVTSAVSTDGGNSYSHAPGPAHLVAALPYEYSPGNPDAYGVFGSSNILKLPDGYYYAMSKVEKYGLQDVGVCVMRTNDLSDPQSWRAWDGTGFDTRFIDRYAEPSESPSAHVCEPVSYSRIGKLADSITYNTYFGK